MMPAGLPEAARAKHQALLLARAAAEDAGRSAVGRLNGLGRDADQSFRLGLEVQRDKAQAQLGVLSRLISATNEFLMKLKNVAVEMAPEVAIELRADEKLITVIGATRDQIKAVGQHLSAVKLAPLPHADELELIAAHVEQLAQQNRPRVNVLGDKLRVIFPDDVITQRSDALSLLAWLMPEAVGAALQRELECGLRPVVNVGAMPRSERLARVRELEAELLKLERKEEALIMRASADGLGDLPRRHDADPRAVLNIVVTRAEVPVPVA
jgi:hypothetical protein